MANNYLQFSQILDIDNQKQADWLKNELTAPCELPGAPDTADPEVFSKFLSKWAKAHDVDLKANYDAWDCWPGFDWKIENGLPAEPLTPTQLWVHDNGEWGNTDNVAHVVQRFLAKFRPKDFWALTWAETCSKPRIGEFNGGGFVVTSKSIKWFSAGHQIDKYCDKLRKAKSAKRTRPTKRA